MITQHMFMLCAQLRTGYKGSQLKTHPCHPQSQQSIRETAEQRGACHAVREEGGDERPHIQVGVVILEAGARRAGRNFPHSDGKGMQ